MISEAPDAERVRAPRLRGLSDQNRYTNHFTLRVQHYAQIANDWGREISKKTAVFLSCPQWRKPCNLPLR
jgi:hypothetical protein